MPCGHWSNPEDQLIWSDFGHPKGKTLYCDRCTKWFKKPPKHKATQAPQEPMF